MRRSSQPEPLVLCSHLPGEGHFESDRFEVIPALCEDEFDYWSALDVVWPSDATIVNVEHDMDVRDEHIAALLDCPHPLCSWAYCCHWASTGLSHDVIAAGSGARDSDTNPDPDYLQGGEEWAAWSAIGLVKIAAEARIGQLRRERWNKLELSVHDAVKRPWHMHGNAVGGAQLVLHHHW